MGGFFETLPKWIKWLVVLIVALIVGRYAYRYYYPAQPQAEEQQVIV
jgi:hypothetical protein